MSKLKFSTADLFCGCGGFSLGMQDTKHFKINYSADIWDEGLKIFKLNHNVNEIEKIDLSQRVNIEKVISKLQGKFDVIVGGPPCQGFSTLGKRRDGDTRSTLVDVFAEIASRCQPKVVLMENVRGIKSKLHPLGGTYLENYFKLLESPADKTAQGYKIRSIELFGPDFGMAQTRRRVFALAIRNDLITGDKEFDAILEKINCFKTKNSKNIKDVIGDLEAITEVFDPKSDKNIGRCNAHLSMNHSEKLKKRLSFIPPGGGLPDVPKQLLTPHLLKMLNGEYGSGGHVKNIYGRLRWTDQVGTIIAGMDKITCGRYVHPSADRLLTPRECARLQTFPDNFTLTGSQVTRYYAIGNAVPPRFSFIVGKAIADFLLSSLIE